MFNVHKLAISLLASTPLLLHAQTSPRTDTPAFAEVAQPATLSKEVARRDLLWALFSLVRTKEVRRPGGGLNFLTGGIGLHTDVATRLRTYITQSLEQYERYSNTERHRFCTARGSGVALEKLLDDLAAARQASDAWRSQKIAGLQGVIDSTTLRILDDWVMKNMAGSFTRVEPNFRQFASGSAALAASARQRIDEVCNAEDAGNLR
jgi:hypothetical protein